VFYTKVAVRNINGTPQIQIAQYLISPVSLLDDDAVGMSQVEIEKAAQSLGISRSQAVGLLKSVTGWCAEGAVAVRGQRVEEGKPLGEVQVWNV
jgi:hypothetical protein